MSNYDAFSATFSNSRKNMHWPEVDAIIEDIEENGYTSVLDIGCGNGRFVGELRKKSTRVIDYLGIDNSAGMVSEAKKLHENEYFQVCDMSELEKLKCSSQYDAIVLLASFHHLETLEERLQCLINIHKLISPVGVVYMTNWNLLEQEKYEKNHRGNGDFDIKIGEYSRYYHGFTLSELENLFLESGFTLLENRIFEGGRNLYSRIAKK